MICVDQSFNKTNDTFSLIMNTYYSPIINRSFKKYVKSDHVWSSELFLFLQAKYFFVDAVHIYKPNWLGNMSLDIFIPSLKIGIEYQGKQHYKSGFFDKTESDLSIQQERDKRKKELCKNNGITLIEWTYKEELGSVGDFANMFNMKVGQKVLNIKKCDELQNLKSIKFGTLLK